MKLRFFVSHKFFRADRTLSLEELRSVVESVVRNASAGRGKFDCEIYYEDTAYGEPLPAGIRSRIQGCHVFICDLSALSPNVMYELGFAHALHKRLVVLQEESESTAIPSDVTDITVAKYASKEEFDSRLRERVASLVRDFIDLDHASLVEPDFRCEWFGGQPSDIAIVCSPEPEKTRFADPASIAYIFIDNLEDRDALLEVSMFLSRAFPDAGIHRHAADGIAHDVLASNLVLLGGPKNNLVTRDFLRLLSIDLHHDSSRITLQLPSGPVHVDVGRDETGLVMEDAGYFGLFPNPLRKGKRVALCVGIHTFGTVGSAKLLDDSFQGLKNAELVRTLAQERGFSAWDSVQMLFKVPVMMNRKVPTPVLEPTKVWFAQ